MSKQKSAPRIPLFSERREPSNRDKYIYGSEKYEDKVKDTFPKAFSRYMSDSGPDGKKVSARKLHTLSGVSKSAINYYLLGSRRVTYETLCAVCIALRLHPMRQRHLFAKAHIMMPGEEPFPNKRDEIIKYYLYNCAFTKFRKLMRRNACTDLHEQIIANRFIHFDSKTSIGSSITFFRANGNFTLLKILQRYNFLDVRFFICLIGDFINIEVQLRKRCFIAVGFHFTDRLIAFQLQSLTRPDMEKFQ